MQGFYFGATGDESKCRADYIADDYSIRVEMLMQSAFLAGKSLDMYKSHVLVHSIGMIFAKAKTHCESGWDKFWDEADKITEEVLKIAIDICEVDTLVGLGVELFSNGAATDITAPVATTCAILDAVDAGQSILDEANNVITEVEDKHSCTKLRYGIAQFVAYHAH